MLLSVEFAETESTIESKQIQLLNNHDTSSTRVDFNGIRWSLERVVVSESLTRGVSKLFIPLHHPSDSYNQALVHLDPEKQLTIFK